MGVAWEAVPSLALAPSPLACPSFLLLSLLSCPAHAGLHPLFSFPVASGSFLGLGGEQGEGQGDAKI